MIATRLGTQLFGRQYRLEAFKPTSHHQGVGRSDVRRL